MTIREKLSHLAGRRYSLPMALTAVAIGSLLTLSVEFWYESSPPNLTVIHSVGMSKAPNGDTLMDVITTGAPAGNCVRVSQHVLY